MKLSKDFIDGFKVSIKNKIQLFPSWNGRRILEKAQLLFGHIEVLEQELDSANGWIELFNQTNKCELLKENTELKQENLQRLEEVKGLQRQVDSLTGLTNKKIEQIRQLNGEVSRAWTAHNAEVEARIHFEAALERAMLDHQPVVLPKEVAEAIDTCKTVMSGISIVTSLDVIGQLFRDYDRSVLDALRVIKHFAQQVVSGGQDLMSALVNGYTVEEAKTPEDKVLNYFNIIAPKDWKFTGNGNDPVYIERNAIRTTCYLLGKEIDGLNSK